MNDLWLFLGIILFLFVLWVYSDGPNNPISFAGPYITPVTAPGVKQVGYGSSANQFLNTGAVFSRTGGVIDSARSPYSEEVRISWSTPTESDERAEYIHLHSESNANIDVTGWQLVGAERGVNVRIPQGSRGSSTSKRDILLTPDYRDGYVISGSRATDSVKSAYDYGKIWHAFLDESDDIWQNDHDTITLLDQNGKVVDQYRY